MTETTTWTKIAKFSEIPEDEGFEVELGGKELAIFKHGEKVFCLENSCPHRGAGLAEGKIVEGEVICPWHGWRFALSDGVCSSLPNSEPATCFETRVENGEVFARIPKE
jgi:nitrite reductase (NADH) small subunit/3-phenylpropionate/trans-cinnamate dioxygenase ferredoxin subunit